MEWENKLGVQHMSPELNGGELTEGGAGLLQDLGLGVCAAHSVGSFLCHRHAEALQLCALCHTLDILGSSWPAQLPHGALVPRL